jgi:hypothetical protein
MTQRIQVQTPVLAAAAGVIGSLADRAGAAHDDAASAEASATAFGGEPAGAAFSHACLDGMRAAAEIQSTVQELSTNVGMAALGYLNTDLGVIPIDALQKMGGFKP